MTEFFEKIWKHLLVFIVGIFIGLMINLPSCSKVEPIEIKVPVHDTVMVDSVRIEQKTKIKYVDRIDTFYIVRNSITEKQDTVYIENLPIEYKNYKDTIVTDSTSTEINIDYHGFSSGIDNISLIHNYMNTTKIIPETKKKLSPFIFIEGGPILSAQFTNMKGAQLGVGAGVYIKDSWGIGASYDVNFRDDITHSVNLQVYKKF